MKNRFENKIVLVTGGNSGIGLAAAKAYAREGAQVIITGRNPESLKTATQEIGNKVLAIKMDVANLKDLDGLYATIKKEFGALDAVFVNAGIMLSKPISEITEQDYDQQMNINVKGAFFTAQKAIPLLRKGGAIVFNASVLGSISLPGSNVYSATKAAVRSMARSFSAEYLDQGIRANVVSPGPIVTPIWNKDGSIPQTDMAQKQEGISQMVPMKRFGQPSEIADAVLFLSSEESSFIAGNEIFVDGGIVQI